MDSRWLGSAIVIIIAALGGWYIFSRPATSQAPSTPPVEQAETTTAMDTPLTPVTVMYTDSGFSPVSVRVTQGQTVTWVNQSSHSMWVASAAHPTHVAYGGTAKETHCATDYRGSTPFDACAATIANASYSFTFDKIGDWKYHNHANATHFGTVVVTAAGVAEDTSPTTTTVDGQ